MAALLLGCERGELLGVIDTRGTLGGSFGTPQLVAAISDPNAVDTDPTFTGDLLELYFTSDRGGTRDIWRALRAAASDPWQAPTRVDEVSSDHREENPCVAHDGLTLWYYSDIDRARGTIWQSRRATRNDVWGTPIPVPELAVGEGSSNVAVDIDEDEHFAALASLSVGSDSYELYWFARDSADQPFGAATLLTSVNSSVNDYDPFFAQNGLFLAFHATLATGEDIFWTQRDSLLVDFPAPTLTPGLNSTANDSAPAFSSDLSYVMFSSTRSGNEEIYEAVRVP